MRPASDGSSISVTATPDGITVRKYLEGGLVASETLARSEVRARLAAPVVARQAWWIGRGITIPPADVEWFADELRIALSE